MSRIRLDRLLGNFGYAPRGEATRWIRQGRVTVAGVVASDPAARADPAEVTVDGAPVPFPRGLLLMLHKPAGTVCSHAVNEGPTVYELLPSELRARDPRPEAVGRLDRDTTGLLLITDLGQLAHRLASPRHETEKRYELATDRPIPEHAEALFAAGTLLLHGERDPCKPALLVRDGPTRASLTLREGRYHQVKRMLAAVGCTVTTLHRASVGPLGLGDLPVGGWRPLTPDERIALAGTDPLAG